MQVADAPTSQGIATVTYEDGRVEQYDLGKPIHTYRLSRIVDLQSDELNEIEVGFMLAWVAAEQVQTNGKAMTADEARAGMLAWLEGVADLKRDDRPAGPPTKRRARSRASRA